LMWAFCANDAGGGKMRSSWSTESMLVVAVDTDPRYFDLLDSKRCVACLCTTEVLDATTGCQQYLSWICL